MSLVGIVIFPAVLLAYKCNIILLCVNTCAAPQSKTQDSHAIRNAVMTSLHVIIRHFLRHNSLSIKPCNKHSRMYLSPDPPTHQRPTLLGLKMAVALEVVVMTTVTSF